MNSQSHQKLYRLSSPAEWQRSQQDGFVASNADDIRDGFLHLSLRTQLKATAHKYYADVPRLLLLCIDAKQIEAILRFEPSSGGNIYPHVYGQIPLCAVSSARPLLRKKDVYVFPKELFA